MATGSTVWKFDFPTDDHFALDLPIGATPLCVMPQYDRPQMWVRCDPSAPRETRHFRLAGTGHPLEGDVGTYVGTFKLYGDDLIFHVFEEQRA